MDHQRWFLWVGGGLNASIIPTENPPFLLNKDLDVAHAFNEFVALLDMEVRWETEAAAPSAMRSSDSFVVLALATAETAAGVFVEVVLDDGVFGAVVPADA